MLCPRLQPLRADLQAIAEMISPGQRVLDIGCGDGSLLTYLGYNKQVDGRGLEISIEQVRWCISRGLSVVQGNADTDLKDYPEQAFDFVILSQTLQATLRPKEVLEQLARIGKRAIISLSNFGHWQVRFNSLWHGKMPITRRLPDPWWATPNIHLCSFADFIALCELCQITIEQKLILDSNNQLQRYHPLANLTGEQGIFRIHRS